MRSLYRVWPSALSPDDVTRILAATKDLPTEPASIFSTADDLVGIRSATVCWLDHDWLRDLVGRYVAEANHEDFSLDLDERVEMQVITYSAHQGDHYDWHHDVDWGSGSNWDRKLSVTIQLSDPATYSGGDLEIEDLQTNADFRSQGTVLVFPSVLRHRISAVTSGTRVALVAWFSGPRWR